MINLFAAHFSEVKILSPGIGNSIKSGNIEYLFQYPSRLERALLRTAHWFYDGILYHSSRAQITPRERRQWWHYLNVKLQPTLLKRVHELVAWSSIAFLECPFWGSVVRRACRKTKRNYLLTFEDVLSDLVTSNQWLRQRVSACERLASRDAAAVFSVSFHDQERFEATGIPTRVIPHGMETEPTLPHVDGGQIPPELQRLQEARSNGAISCLFIGSSLRCNLEAVEEIRKIAASLVNRADIRFVIAGACLPRGDYGDKITALGPVEEAILLQLYRLTDLVLAPLISGTGTSLKVLEAFIHGKPLLSTRVGVRGHPVQDGRDCIVCDDLERFSEIILALSGDPARRRKLGESGRQFVKAFDYRVVYQPYLAEIEKFAR